MARDVLLLIENHINNMRARAQIKINKGMCEQENLISKAMKKVGWHNESFQSAFLIFNSKWWKQ